MKLTAIIMAVTVLAFGSTATDSGKKEKDDKPIAISISAEDVSPGEEATLKISLDENEDGISMLRGTIRSSGLKPTGASGGYIKNNADDLLYSIEGDSILLVWGKGDGREKLDKGLGSSYSYHNTCDDFLTLTYTVPEDAGEGAEYSFTIEGEMTAVTGKDKEISLTAEPCSIRVKNSSKQDAEKETQAAFGSGQSKEEAGKTSPVLGGLLFLAGLVIGTGAMLVLSRVLRGSGGSVPAEPVQNQESQHVVDMVKQYQKLCEEHEEQINRDLKNISYDLGGIDLRR